MNWKKVVNITIKILFLLAVAAGYGFSYYQMNNRLISDYTIEINGPDGLKLVNEKAIRSKLEQTDVQLVKTRPLKQYNLHLAEKLIEQMPHVANAEVWANFNGEICIEVDQRVPVLRIINQNQQSYYVDSNGLKMPLSSIGAYRVPVATGNIREKSGIRDSLSTPIGHQLWQMALFLRENKSANALTAQIHVNEQEQLEIIPMLGNHTVVLGDTSSLNDKYFKLEALYRDGFRDEDWNKYSLINLQYKELIVCRKAK
jgi:cell division protein FtsQ